MIGAGGLASAISGSGLGGGFTSGGGGSGLGGGLTSGGGGLISGGGGDVLTNITGTTTSAMRLSKPWCNAHNANTCSATTLPTMAQVLAFMSTEMRRPFFLERCHAFAYIRPGKAHEFQRQRGIE